MVRVNTAQYGELEITFRHDTGDPNIEARRILHAHYRDNGVEDKEARAKAVKDDLCFIDKIEAMGKFTVLVKTPERKTTAYIRVLKEEDNPFKDVVFHGFSYVFPSDHYNKEIGRVTSLDRAIDQLPGVTEKTRREIMAGYFSR